MATLSLTVGASADDAKLDDLGYDETGTTIQVGASNTTNTNFGQGFRFTNVTLTGGDFLQSAKMSLYKSGTQFQTQEDRYVAIDEDNTATFSSGSPPGSRAITTASPTSESHNVSHTDATRYEFPTAPAQKQVLAASISEVLDRGGWSSGNALAIANNSDQDPGAITNSSRKAWHAWDSSTGSSEPQLIIDYIPEAELEMAHVAADRVQETTTTTGTGTITLAGAATGYTTFGSVMANGDTTFYAIVHQSANEWEVGLGTWNTGGTLARTTLIRSSTGSAVSFSAGTKDVIITAPAIGAGWGALTVSPSANQNDYNPTGLGFASRLRLTPTATLKLTGLAGGLEGRRMTIQNGATDYLVWLENENTASSAANRFKLPLAFPLWLMPGDCAAFVYDGIAQRWVYMAGSQPGPMGLQEFSDFATAGVSAAAPTTSGSVGPFSIITAGTGATAQISTYLANATEKPMGIQQFDSGTTATGRAGIGSSGTDDIIPTLGPALSVARLAVETTVTGTETFQVLSGFIDCLAAGATTDGVAWNNRWNGSAAEWSQDRFAAAGATRTTTGSPAPDNNYIWLVVFVNPGWTRADFIYSTDSIAFTLASSPSTGFPSVTQRTAWTGAAIVKSAGTTARNVTVDLAGYRVDYVRG